MAVVNYFSGFEPPAEKPHRWPKTLGRILLIASAPAAIWALVWWGLNGAGDAYMQPDAVFYRQLAGQPVVAGVLTRFQATSTSYRGGRSTTTGTDHAYAVAYDLPTGRQLWKTTLETPDNQGKTYGDMLLLGQSSHYLFYVRNGLFTLDKQTGRVVAGPGDYGPASAHLSHEQAIDFPSDQNYRYNDSLQAVLARGTDGLYYAVTAQTLRAVPYSPPPAATRASRGAQGDYDSSGGFNRPESFDYDDWLTDVVDDGRRCLALLDDQDTVLAAHNSYGVAERSRTESVRRRLYQTTSDNSGSWQPLNGQVFLFGGLLVDPHTRYQQPTDSVSRLRAYQSLRDRYPTPYAPLRLPDGGLLIAHKATIERNAPVLLTAVSPTGQVRWQAASGYFDLSLLYADQPAGKLYLLGAAVNSGSSRLRQVRVLDLRTGQFAGYELRASNPWW